MWRKFKTNLPTIQRVLEAKETQLHDLILPASQATGLKPSTQNAEIEGGAHSETTWRNALSSHQRNLILASSHSSADGLLTLLPFQ